MRWLGQMLDRLRPGDMLVITADHGNDPTAAGSDHTRERVPVLVAGQGAGKSGIAVSSMSRQVSRIILVCRPRAGTELSAMSDFANLPKLELHLHLEGAAPPAFIRGLAQRKGVDCRDIRRPTARINTPDFVDFLRVYEAACSCPDHPAGLSRPDAGGAGAIRPRMA